MTIYGVGYRALDYRLEPIHKRLWPIVRLELRSLFRTRWGVVLFLLCLTPVLVYLVFLLLQLGVLVVIPRSAQPDPSGLRLFPGPANALGVRFYTDPVVTWSFVPILILTSLVTSRAIAKDRATNALEIYWTRGISPFGYLASKWLGSVCLVACVTVLGPLAVWLIGSFLAPDWTYIERTAHFMPGVLLGNLGFTALLTLFAIAVSAVANTPNLATILWLLLMVGSWILGGLLDLVTRGQDWVRGSSVWDSGGRLVQWVAGDERQQDLSPSAAGLWILAWTVLLSWFLWRRLRMTEAIS